ncbi:MAG: amino acid ABC transporter permease [Tenericutes bacterium HGW-Tenericutes-3]|nr:MAG: amino acid ABC transporter permease [Tenericutes bacterium HGW-Tenericutes-3]
MSYLIETGKYLASGAAISLSIFFLTLLIAFPLGMIVAVFYRSSKITKKIVSFYTWLFRGTPLMLQLFFFMFALPAIGIPVDRMMVAYIAFIVNYTAYFTEIIRAGIENTEKDQIESAAVMGANKAQIYYHIIMPQAVRKQIPTITNEVITLIKDTALVTVIAISDIMRSVKEVVSRDFTLSPFLLAAIFYLLISYIIITIFKAIEKRFDFIENPI